MNKIEREILNRAKKLAVEYIKEEIENARQKIEASKDISLIDIFNSGLMLDLRKLKLRGIEQIQKRLEKKV